MLCANAGIGVLFWTEILVGLLRYHSLNLPPQLHWRFMFMLYGATVPAAAAILFLRRRFVRLSPAIQRAILIAVVLVTATGFVIFFWSIYR